MQDRKSHQNVNRFNQSKLTYIGEKNLANLIIKYDKIDKTDEKYRADPSEISPAMERQF